jgi:hypothetical protein
LRCVAFVLALARDFGHYFSHDSLVLLACYFDVRGSHTRYCLFDNASLQLWPLAAIAYLLTILGAML